MVPRDRNAAHCQIVVLLDADSWRTSSCVFKGRDGLKGARQSRTFTEVGRLACSRGSRSVPAVSAPLAGVGPAARRAVRPRAVSFEGGGHRPQESACLCPATGVCGTVRTTRQPNTHNIESRTVCYPWHPWFGHAVGVYEMLVKYGHSVCRCGHEEERTRRSVEIPTWMFEPATCDRLCVMTVPTVGCDALCALKTVLRSTPRPDGGDVLQAQHRSLLAAGGVDATVSEPIAF